MSTHYACVIKSFYGKYQLECYCYTLFSIAVMLLTIVFDLDSPIRQCIGHTIGGSGRVKINGLNTVRVTN